MRMKRMKISLYSASVVENDVIQQDAWFRAVHGLSCEWTGLLSPLHGVKNELLKQKYELAWIKK